jgi:hypothetical protein
MQVLYAWTLAATSLLDRADETVAMHVEIALIPRALLELICLLVQDLMSLTVKAALGRMLLWAVLAGLELTSLSLVAEFDSDELCLVKLELVEVSKGLLSWDSLALPQDSQMPRRYHLFCHLRWHRPASLLL